jgi:hypothetical protein
VLVRRRSSGRNWPMNDWAFARGLCHVFYFGAVHGRSSR